MTRIDNYLLAIYQRIADTIQWLTGISCYRLAEQCFIVACVPHILACADYWIPTTMTLRTGRVLDVVCTPLLVWLNLWMARLAGQAAASTDRQVRPSQVAEVDATVPVGWRCVLFVAAMTNALPFPHENIFDYVSDVSHIAFISGVYFMLVVRRPVSRVRSKAALQVAHVQVS